MSAVLPGRAIRAAGTGLLLLLCGCVVQMGFTNPQQRAAALALFRTGQATLSCVTGWR